MSLFDEVGLLPSMSMAVIRQGGRGAGDPPLTIPNREVKPRSADGTGKPGEQGAAPVEGKASEGHLRGLLFILRHREACPLPAFLLRFVPRAVAGASAKLHFRLSALLRMGECGVSTFEK